MIDFVKLNDLVKGDQIQDLLDFEIKVNHRTGEELLNRKRSSYLKNLVFTVTPGERFVKMQGSLHKFSNDGDWNNDRFTYEKFLNVADDLKQYISNDDQINVIEFAVNLEVSFNPTDFIKNLICHLRTPFNKTFRSGISYSQVEYKHFIIKIYNKSLQQPSGSNILRIEVKYLRMQKLSPEGLKWSNLSNIDTWLIFGDIIRKKFSEIIYYDPSVNLKELPVKDLQFIKDGRNPFFWSDLTGPHVDRTRKQYQFLIRKHGNRFNNLPEVIDREIKELVKSYHNSDNETDMRNLYRNRRLVKSLPLLYANLSPRPSNKMFCEVTGIDISMQKSGSRFLSSAGIKYLYLNNKELFEKLRDERLSAKWMNEDISIQFREICHSIRNEFFNPGNNTKKSLRNIMKDPLLFDITPFISSEKRKIIREKNETDIMTKSKKNESNFITY